MHQTNASYRSDSDGASLGNSSPSRLSRTSSGRVRPIQDLSIHSMQNSPQITTDRQVETINISEPISPTVDKEEDEYYSLKRLQERRRGERDEDSALSRRVRRFYKKQDELIDIYERANMTVQGGDNPNANAEKIAHEKTLKLSNIFAKVSLAVNIVRIISFR